jgi:hypothetical protein
MEPFGSLSSEALRFPLYRITIPFFNHSFGSTTICAVIGIVRQNNVTPKFNTLFGAAK